MHKIQPETFSYPKRGAGAKGNWYEIYCILCEKTKPQYTKAGTRITHGNKNELIKVWNKHARTMKDELK
jgi:hypothetical protein